jgi:hypothetical protein
VITRVLLLSVGLVRIAFRGQINPDARFIVPNQVCFFDGFLFLGLALRPLGKRELLRIPCLTDMCDVYDGIAVDRTRSLGLLQVLLESDSDPNKPVIVILPRGRVDIRRLHVPLPSRRLPLQSPRPARHDPLQDLGHNAQPPSHLLRMCKACLVFAGVRGCASGGSAGTKGLGLASGGDIIVPLSVFFPLLAAVLCVTQVARSAFDHARITSVIIHHYV